MQCHGNRSLMLVYVAFAYDASCNEVLWYALTGHVWLLFAFNYVVPPKQYLLPTLVCQTALLPQATFMESLGAT